MCDRSARIETGYLCCGISIVRSIIRTSQKDTWYFTACDKRVSSLFSGRISEDGKRGVSVDNAT
jgi:hypothetical protein